jgi:hypothetical protein
MPYSRRLANDRVTPERVFFFSFHDGMLVPGANLVRILSFVPDL